MGSEQVKATNQPQSGKSAPVKKMVRKQKLSLTKMILRWCYWLILLGIFGVVLYIGGYTGWVIYLNTRS